MKTCARIFAVLTLTLAAGSKPAQAQQLLAWPIGNNIYRGLLPGMPIHPLPPLPRPLPHPRPQPRPMPVPPPDISPVALTGYQVEGDIEDQVANLTYHITFHNPTGQRLEGVLLVPIPADTVLSGFTMTVGNKKMAGELLEADKAGAVYQSIVSRMRDPGLLELVGERLMRAKVFPIEPNGDVAVQLSMTQLLPKSGGLVSLNVPVKSARMLQGTPGRAKVSLTLNASKDIRTLYSPNPDVLLDRVSDKQVKVSYEEKASGEPADLNLFYSLREDPLAASLLTFKEEGEDGYFLLTLSPRPKADESKVVPKDVVFILDRSGSMSEDGKIEQARKALAYCIRHLSAKDRFGIVDFATDSNSFEDHLVSANHDNKARAERYVERLEPAGGTNIEAALSDGMKLLKSPDGRVPMVFFLTDGVPTVGQTDIPALLKKAAESNHALSARVFSFGVGSDVNTLFLDKLAETNRGAHDYVQPGENIENKVSSLYQKVAKPALSDVSIRWEGVEAQEVYPRPINDLFFGSEMVLMGRYKGHGKGALAVSGQAAGDKARFEFPVDFPATASRNAFLPRLWANLKVSHEMDAIRLSGNADPEVVKDIVKLAKRYGIVTPYTSYLITEEGANMQAAQNAAFQSFRSLSADAASSGMAGGASVAMSAQRSSMFFSRLKGTVSSLSGAGGVAGASMDSGGAMRPMAQSAAPQAMVMREAEAETRQELTARGQAAAQTRTIADKTFYLRGETWVDGDYELAQDKDARKRVKIAYLSSEYFDLINREPALARYLSVGPKVTVSYRETVYEISDAP